MLITFTAYILIPVYTLLFVAGSDWFTTNFSVLGDIAGRNEAFVLWGLMVWGIGIIVAVSAFLFILAGIVSSALEIFFTVSMTWMVYGLYKNMTAGDGVS